MGEIAATLSDVAIITSDNPRSEDPHGIIREILKGIDTARCPELEYDQLTTGNGFFVEPDRRKALETAVAASTPGDILVAAGKGHETYQILKNGTIHFDDREILARALAGVQEPGETP
jgi:UDP-N-acetylmuramyl tripeptide synthase